ITELAQGYETVVGERGVTLSGGQKQRVAIARMLLQNAPVMVFDDSLSAVDAETDAKIRAALKERMADATVILISHRVTTLMQADRILVLDGGRVSDVGAHGDLISRPGIYKDIYDIQMSSDDRALVEEGRDA
ncbi:MAG: ATP-binding cassette domain-containing protein, partial [Oscillospiraceae bacterium]|nr:ATP-binding cassette domain-containing protein [Oscillospiraceae bacterium]